jgi:signal transduction histidine kinase
LIPQIRRYRFLTALAFCVCTLWLAPAWATDKALDAAPDAPEPVSLTRYISVLEDPAQVLTLADVQGAQLSTRFRNDVSPTEDLNFGYTRSAFWLRFTVQNTSDSAVQRMLEIRQPGLSHIAFHQPGVGGEATVVETGSLVAFASRPHASRFFVFPVHLPARSSQLFFMRVQSNGPISVPALLWEPSAFHAYERADYSAQAWYFGVAAAMILFNLLLFISLRDRAYLLYVAFVSCMALTIAAQNGLAKEFLWTDSPGWTNIAVNVGYSLSIALLLVFMRHMVNTRATVPRIDYFLKWLTGIFFILPLGFMVALPTLIKPAALLYALAGVLILMVGGWCAFKRQRSAYFFVAAFAALCFAAIVSVLRALGWVPTTSMTVNALQYGSALEMLLLAFSLADRFNVIRLERARAQHESLREKQKLVDALQTSERELEERVHQRTAELDIKNAALTQAMSSLETVERIARHDLKTPLGSLAAAPSMLRAGRVMAVAEEKILTMMESAANRALNMVNLSLDLYRMESGSYVPHPGRVDLTALVQAVAQDLKAQAQSKNVTIQVSGSVQGVLACAEEPLCYSIVANLMKNAVEAAPIHSIVSIVFQSGPMASLSILNRGAVPEALRATFFAKYSTAGKLGGAGLGTYSSHLLTSVQGGHLTMETSDAIGTSLTLELPLWNPAEDAGPSIPTLPESTAGASEAVIPTEFGTQRVLIVDDDEFNRMVLLAQMPAPLEVESAVNGRAALEAVMCRPYGLIIMDIDMPIMGGMEALQRIRAFQENAGQTPSCIVAYSANDSQQNHAAYLAHGFDKCLSKPGSQKEVLALLC